MADQETPKPQVEVVGNPKKEEPAKEVKPVEEKLSFTKEAFNDLIEGRLARQKDSLTKEYGITPQEALTLKAEQEKVEKQKEIEKGDFEMSFKY